LTETVDGIQDRLSAKPWRLHSRKGFIYNLGETHEQLSGVAHILQQVREEFRDRGKEDALDLKKHLNDIQYLLEVLEMNRKMEAELHEKTAQDEGISLDERMKPNDAHAVLEQRVSSVLLNTRYIIERLQLEERKESASVPSGQRDHKNLITLLDKKETEFQQMKQKYEELRNQSYLGKIEAGTAADRELEWADLTRVLVAEHSALSEGIKQYREQMDTLNTLHHTLEQRFSALDELSIRHANETNDLIRNLKKERDYARTVVTDIEHETFKLRGVYSKELLNLESEKARIREQAGKRVKNRIASLEKELAEKSEKMNRLHQKVNESETKLSAFKKRKK